MSSSIPLTIAETIQTASIKEHPSPAFDITPSTATDKKTPVTEEALPSPNESDEDAEDEEDIPYSVIRPISRKRTSLPPLPDLRFEQSYLASIRGADTYWAIAYITVRDQVLLPLVQGTLWTLALVGWRHWNAGASFSGNTVGSRIRRWWWGVNNWSIPEKRVSLDRRAQALADRIRSFYEQ